MLLGAFFGVSLEELFWCLAALRVTRAEGSAISLGNCARCHVVQNGVVEGWELGNGNVEKGAV